MKKRFLLGVLTLAISSCLIACKDPNTTQIINIETQTKTEVEANEPEQSANLDVSSASDEEAEEKVPPFTLDQTYYESEQCIQLTPLNITNDPGNIVWTSEDPNVAQVVNGRLLYLAEGETVISADTEDVHKEIKVKVNSSILFSSPLESVTVKEHDKYILVVDNDVTVPDGFEDKFSEFMTLVEKRTGFSYVHSDKKGSFYLSDPEMIFVVISDKISTSFASSDYVFLKSEHLIPDEENGISEEKIYAVILEELLHCVQHRHSVYLGNALCEGYAIVNAYRIVEEDLGYSGALDRYITEQVEYLEWFDRLSTKNVYKMLIDEPVDVHPYSFFFVKYLYEAYGNSIMDQLIQSTNAAFYEISPEYYGGGSSAVLTSEDFLNVIISETSETVLSDYVNWMRENKYN